MRGLVGAVLLLAGVSRSADSDATLSPAALAAPWRVMFRMPGDGKLIVLDDWPTNQKLLLAVSAPVLAIPRDLPTRRRYEVALFWGVPLDGGRAARERPELFPFERAQQFAYFYPATTREPALWAFVGGQYLSRDLVRSVGTEGLALLRAHGVEVGPRRRA